MALLNYLCQQCFWQLVYFLDFKHRQWEQMPCCVGIRRLHYLHFVNTSPSGTVGANGIVPWTSTPSQVNGSYTGYGYAPLGSAIPNALEISTIGGQETLMDWNLYMLPTATGAQGSGATCVDGITPASGKAVSAGLLPVDMHVRYEFRLGTDMMAPEYYEANGGKISFGLSNSRAAIGGNGGYSCSQPANIRGRMCWSNRQQWKYAKEPNSPLFGKLAVGAYIYDANEFQFDHMETPAGAMSPEGWHSVEMHTHINGYTDTGGTAADTTVTLIPQVPSNGQFGILNQGTTCTNGQVVNVQGGTETQTAQLTLTVAAGKVTSAAVTRGGVYTVYAPSPQSVDGSCDALFDVPPVNTASSDGYTEMWVDGDLVMRTNNHMLRGTPPWVPYASPPLASGLNVMPANGGIAFVWGNWYCGGTSGCPANPMHLFIKNIVVTDDDTYIGPVLVQ